MKQSASEEKDLDVEVNIFINLLFVSDVDVFVAFFTLTQFVHLDFKTKIENIRDLSIG